MIATYCVIYKQFINSVYNIYNLQIKFRIWMTYLNRYEYLNIWLGVFFYVCRNAKQVQEFGMLIVQKKSVVKKKKTLIITDILFRLHCFLNKS